MFPSYKVITSKSVLDIPYESAEQNERDCELLIIEQDKILKELGFKLLKCYKLHFFESRYTSNTEREMEIEDAIQCLAIKDGVDLVQFDNGNYGYVAYYNGVENGFEILNEREDDEDEE